MNETNYYFQNGIGYHILTEVNLKIERIQNAIRNSEPVQAKKHYRDQVNFWIEKRNA